MNTPQFMELLLRNRFPDPIEVQQVPNGYLSNHEHPFEVIALVIEGSINITIDGLSRVYGVGDIFVWILSSHIQSRMAQMALNILHPENIRSICVGRRYFHGQPKC